MLDVQHVLELSDEDCTTLENVPPPKQQVVYRRSFNERVTTYESIRKAVCIISYLARYGKITRIKAVPQVQRLVC